MTVAWAKYDRKTGNILSVSWIKEDENDLIEIERDLAEKFILGEAKLTEYKATIDQDSFRLEKVKIEKPLVRYSSVKSTENSENYSVSASKKTITITIDKPLNKNIFLYATLKDSPSWLVKSWNLSSSMVKNNKIVLKFNDAQNYSYYVRSIDEA